MFVVLVFLLLLMSLWKVKYCSVIWIGRFKVSVSLFVSVMNIVCVDMMMIRGVDCRWFFGFCYVRELLCIRVLRSGCCLRISVGMMKLKSVDMMSLGMIRKRKEMLMRKLVMSSVRKMCRVKS